MDVRTLFIVALVIALLGGLALHVKREHDVHAHNGASGSISTGGATHA